MAVLKNGTLVDKLKKLQLIDNDFKEQIKEIENKRSPIKEKMLEIEETLLSRFKDDKLTACSGKLATAKLDEKEYGSVINHAKFCEYVVKTESWDLIANSIPVKAFRERLDDKELVPGTKKFTKTTIKLLKP